jgi:type II secretory pathway component PulL
MKPAEVYLSVPLDLVTFRELSFPFSDKSKINDAIPYELDGILLGDINNYLIDHIIVDTTDSGSKVLAACLEKSKLQEIIAIFSSLELEPKIVTSLDLRLSKGKSDELFIAPVTDKKIRSDAAGQELLNHSINLRQDELSYRGDIERFKKNLRLTAILAIIISTILSASSIFSFVNLDKENKSLNENIQGIYRRVFPEDKKIIDAARQFKGKMNMLLKKKEALAGIPVLDSLRDIALQKKRRITLHEFNADGKNIIIKGAAESFEDVESLKNTLMSGFKGVKVIESATSADNKIIFTILMQDRTS